MSSPIESVSISSSEETKESSHVDVRVPRWPYDKWKLSENTAEGDTERRSPKHSKPTMAGPVFVKFLELFSNQLDVLTTSESKEILNDITTLLRKSLEELGKCHKCFEQCRLIQAGSVAEKTKVGEPNEFDFLIVLDYFSNKELFKVEVRKNDFKIYVKQPANVDDLPFIMCDALTPEDVGCIDNSLRSQFMEMLLQIIDKYLPSEWRRVKVENEVICCSGIACTLHLVSEKFNLNVDVDLCPCLQIDVDDFEGALVMPEDISPLIVPYFSEQVLFFGYIKDILEITKLELFAILGKRSFSPDAISTRITAPLLELSCFPPYGAEDGHLKTYCITKCILSGFLPRQTNVFGCKYCCHKLIRSYHVKNIFFYMLKNYEEDIYWQDDKVPLRVLEIFLILRQCMDLRDEESSNDAAISTFCLPGTLYLENVTNSSPYYAVENGSEFFFTPDSHKPMYQLSSSPVFEEYLTTGNDEADCALKEWFNTLNNKPWNSKQLLQDLITLLVRLNEIVP